MDYTQYTLGMFLSAKDEVIKRNAVSILKQLQKNKKIGFTASNCAHLIRKLEHGANGYWGYRCEKCKLFQ